MGNFLALVSDIVLFIDLKSLEVIFVFNLKRTKNKMPAVPMVQKNQKQIKINEVCSFESAPGVPRCQKI